MIRSLRWRMLAGTSLATGAILASLGLVLYASMQATLIREFDASCLVQARALGAMAEWKRDHLKFDGDAQMPQFSRQDNPEYFELRADSGALVAQSVSLGDGVLTMPTPAAAPLAQPAYEDVSLPDGRRGRGIALRFTPQSENDDDENDRGPAAPSQGAVVLFAKGTDALDATLGRLRQLLATAFGAAILVSGAVLSAVVTGAMKPLRHLANRIESIGADRLSLRIASDEVPVELKPVVDRLNDLLARLDSAFVRERAFTADVAHELRTPIAGLHATLEVCRSRPRTAADYEEAIDKCLKMSGGIGSMIRTLLLLGRADAGQLAAERSAVDVASLLEECWASLAPRAAAKSVRVERDIQSGTIDTDVAKLAMILNNLFDNAVSYVNEGGAITIAATRIADELRIEITNTGSRIAAAQVPHLTERFWRGDESRSATGMHCGLGLSLCNRLAPVIGGRLTMTSEHGTFSAVLILPHALVAAQPVADSLIAM
jgi:two-component system sensor histidine kinase QseC